MTDNLRCGGCGEIYCQWCQHEIDKAMGVRRRPKVGDWVFHTVAGQEQYARALQVVRIDGRLMHFHDHTHAKLDDDMGWLAPCRRGALVRLGADTFEWDFVDDGDQPDWFVRCLECLATMNQPTEHQSRRNPGERCRAIARPGSGAGRS